MNAHTAKVLNALRRPTWPGTIERPARRRNIGLAYDTSWTRTPTGRAVRALALDGIALPLVRALASPTILGADVLDHLGGPVIFAANHSSHLDTSLVLESLPLSIRRKTVVGAAADYFFDRPWKAAASSLLLGAIPVERSRVNRQSADIAASLIQEGWNLVIFPEGGRSPDGWGQEFHPVMAAYLAKRCGVPVVPLHLDGARAIFPKGSTTIRPGKTTIRFGSPMVPKAASGREREEDARRFALRLEHAVAALADEAESDWWSARKRAASGSTPPFRGPDIALWRRSWSLPAGRRQDHSRGSLPKPW
ncbi:MAG TPA: lysophospholipid acyltransferase family protein [Acidimicrobiales bacterium]|nr:lysophospholipid acyltransferase family protein [Acidimicrobiales bacterium]